MADNNSDDVELASRFTVRDYKAALAKRDTKTIAEALDRRFKERYIEPASAQGKHGFTIMAVSCLMIEALESFRQGWESTRNRSKSAFCFFFDTSDLFIELRGHAQQFFKHIRCGILHQAETTGGWRIVRRGPLFDSASLTLNATCFLNHLSKELDHFCARLQTAEWDSSEWENVRRKMKALCDNCSRQLPPHTST